MIATLTDNDVKAFVPRSLAVSAATVNSPGAGRDAVGLQEQLLGLVWPSSHAEVRESGSSKYSLFERRITFKVQVANVAMHIRSEWRKSMFKQIDELLDPDNWEVDEALPSEASVRTFLRTITYLRFRKCPGLGAFNGDLIASWSNDGSRLTLDFRPNDEVRWAVSRKLGDEREVASGLTKVLRLAEVLAPYDAYSWILE